METFWIASLIVSIALNALVSSTPSTLMPIYTEACCTHRIDFNADLIVVSRISAYMKSQCQNSLQSLINFYISCYRCYKIAILIIRLLGRIGVYFYCCSITGFVACEAYLKV